MKSSVQAWTLFGLQRPGPEVPPRSFFCLLEPADSPLSQVTLGSRTEVYYLPGTSILGTSELSHCPRLSHPTLGTARLRGQEELDLEIQGQPQYK